MWDAKQILTQTFYLPKQYGFDIETQYLEYYDNGHRYIMYPLSDTVTGDTGDNGVTVDVQNLPAIDMYNGVLMMYNVDEIDGEEIISIG